MGGVLVVGAGFLGRAIASCVDRSGDRATLASRAWRDALRDVRPDALVLVHGPSDVTWCDRHPEVALAAHRGAAEWAERLAPSLPKLLVSTDNVFAGDRQRSFEDDPPAPANGYGRAKLAAERALGPSSVVLRCSLVYGWSEAGRTNFFDDTARALARGEEVAAPLDQWTTPVLVGDLAHWVVALLGADVGGVVHLGGPDRVSRFEWARLIADELGADPSLVRPVARAESGFACRPANACLGTSRCLSALAGLEPVGVREGLRRLGPLREVAWEPVRG